ncbi:ABC transporter substrate-binding protein [Halocatena marina]|uniref:ABC transporter substrate-binding protein n=1 Tax=Halocatena marina TaxID=2934937 RepID=A0ABD5YJ29_9EURY|nr:ABC transporter substrate-binding protein [Halocatena marina]
MVEKATSHRDILNRRQFVGLVGVSGAAALAGCTFGNNGGDGGGGENGRHTSYTNIIPKNMQWNPSNPSKLAEISGQVLFDAFAKYNFATSEFKPYAISDWEYGGNTFKMTIRDGLTWANGDDVTSADVATQLRIGLHTGETYADYTDSIETPDDKTVVMKFNSTINKKIVQFQILSGRFVRQKKSVFGEYLEKIKKNKKEGIRELQEFAWQEPIASGPFEFDSAGQQQLLLTLRDDHPDSKKINFGEYVFVYKDGNEAVQQALQNQTIDSAFSLFMPTRIVEELPDSVKQIQLPGNWGYGLVPNHSHRHAGDRAVRQAIQYVINRKQVMNNVSADSKQVPEIPIGIASSNQKQWLGDAMSSFETYGVDSSQTKKAAAVLKEAGYSKQGGTWTDKDGTAVKLPILVPSDWTDWNTATQTIVDQLTSFGFEATVDGRSFGNLQGNIWPNGDYAISAGGWLDGAPQGAYPYFSLHHQLVKNFRGFTYNYPAADQSRGGSRNDVTVPSRTGSGTMTVNPSKRLNEMATNTEEAKIKEIVVEQAWVTNQDLPMIPVLEKLEQTFLTAGDKWDIPKPDADVAQVRWANTWLPRMGEMKYTGN